MTDKHDQDAGAETSREITALTGNGGNTLPVAFAPHMAGLVRKAYGMSADFNINGMMLKSLGFGFVQMACAGSLAIALAVGATPALLPVLAALGVNAGAGVLSRPRRKKLKKAFSESALTTYSLANTCLFIEMREKYIKAQWQLAALADAHVKDGHSLDENTLSYLAALPPTLFEKSSDSLAVTVLQARQAAGFARGLCEKPATFKRLKFQAGEPSHLHFLRMVLADEASRFTLAEEIFSEEKDFKALSLLPGMTFETPEMGKLAKLASLFIPFASAAWLLIKVSDTGIPDRCLQKAGALKYPPLKRIEDFPEMLDAYRKEHGALDLPALAAPQKRIATPKALLPRN